MFGYVNINKQELKVKEYYKYKAYYCGLCHQLKERYGCLGQMTLTYDMTFLVIVLTSLYECDVKQMNQRCLAHPASKHTMIMNEITNYAADMNIALTYHKLMDDWADDKSYLHLGGAKMLARRYHKIEKRYPRQCQKICECLKTLDEVCKAEPENLDAVSRPFGELMSELFVYQEDSWEETLRSFGFYLGKFIYILDAYDDLEDDIQKGSYNPLIGWSKKAEFEIQIQQMLTMIMAECAKAFEILPLLWDVELLRNILYAGVWKKYDEKKKKLKEKRKEAIL